MYDVEDIREQFRIRKLHNTTVENGTLELRGVTFEASDEPIFGERNEDYLRAELKWYASRSRDVKDLFKIYGKTVQIWRDCADINDRVNSNYGWCIYSKKRGFQYHHVLDELTLNPSTRQATMIYTHPNMHKASKADYMNDFTCTCYVQYFIRGGVLETYVYMRSNDAIFGYTYDYPWQRVVRDNLIHDLSRRGYHYKPGPIQWSAGSLHIYPRHFGLIK